MPSDDVIALPGSWEGYRVLLVERRAASKEGEPDEIWVEPARQAKRFVCSGCGRSCEKVHDVTERWIRDLPILDARTHVLVPRYRVACRVCGPKLEPLSGLAPGSRVTRRLAESVSRLCGVLAIQHVAEFYGSPRRLDWASWIGTR